MTQQLTLTYFDFHGGRGEPARLAFAVGGIPFDDKRFAYPEFAVIRKATPFGQVPTLHVDGQLVTQSDAITRYAGQLAGLYPADPYQALLCDEVLGVVEDANNCMQPTFGLKGDALKTARSALAEGALPMYLRWMQSALDVRGGQFFADGRLTVADLKVFVYVRGLNSGRLDHIPSDLVQTIAPRLNDHAQRIAQTPAIAAYYARLNR